MLPGERQAPHGHEQTAPALWAEAHRAPLSVAPRARRGLVALLALLVPVQGAFAAPPPVPKAAAWIVEAPGHGGLLAQHAADSRREIASLTKLMTAHLCFATRRSGSSP